MSLFGIIYTGNYVQRLCFLTYILCFLNVTLSSVRVSEKNNGSYVETWNSTEGSNIIISLKSLNIVENALPPDNELIEDLIVLLPSSVYSLQVTDIPIGVHFIVLQAHSYLYNVTLSYNKMKQPHQFITGYNVGLVQIVSSSGIAQFYLENNNTFNATVLVTVVAYGNSAPIPGGCNMEYSVETAPYLHVKYTAAMVTVDFQPAAIPMGWIYGITCTLPTIYYEVYHMYMPEKDHSIETYFDSIKKMMTVDRIRENGRKVAAALTGPEMRRVFSAYRGTGSVFGVIANNGPRSYSAYVPAQSYSCSTVHYTDGCQVLTSAFSKAVCAVILFVGLFMCIFGHTFFKTEMFLLSFLTGGLITYILVTLQQTYSGSFTVFISSITGIGSGLLWLFVWSCFGIPILSVLIATFNVGILITSIIFYAGLGDYPLLESDVNYWLSFACCILVITVCLICSMHKANVLACALIGSYTVIIPIDYYNGSNLKYIIINIIRRATVDGFETAIIDPPFQSMDAILTFVWVVLAIHGYILQTNQLRHKPPFPPPRSHRWRHNQEASPLLRDTQYSYYTADSITPGSDNVFE